MELFCVKLFFTISPIRGLKNYLEFSNDNFSVNTGATKAIITIPCSRRSVGHTTPKRSAAGARRSSLQVHKLFYRISMCSTSSWLYRCHLLSIFLFFYFFYFFLKLIIHRLIHDILAQLLSLRLYYFKNQTQSAASESIVQRSLAHTVQSNLNIGLLSGYFHSLVQQSLFCFNMKAAY